MSTVKEKIETFVELSTMDSLDLANRITAAFEEMGIPVLLEHLNIQGQKLTNSYRVSTQTQFAENAMRIVSNMTAAHETKKHISTREKIVY